MGCVHIYCGDGKGKTTAAAGLAVRMQGTGGKVVAARFLKKDDSGEVKALKGLSGIEVLPCTKSFGFTWQMTEKEKKEAAGYYEGLFDEAWEKARFLCLNFRQEEKEKQEALLASCAKDCQVLLVLDELCAAVSHGFVPEKKVLDFLRKRPYNLEVVITGRNPSEALLQEADYVSEILCRKHPFERGLAARRGIEF